MLKLELENTKCFGTYGVSLCATYFLAHGYQVLMPYGDRGHYDLAVEKDGVFQRVQCKYSSQTKKGQGYPVISLRVFGSSAYNGKLLVSSKHMYSIDDFDLLWVVTPQTCYLIPLKDILHSRETKADLKLYPKWDKYRVAIPIPFPSDEEGTAKRSAPRLTSEDKATIRRLTKEGMKQQDIADILGVTRGCISQFLSRNPE